MKLAVSSLGLLMPEVTMPDGVSSHVAEGPGRATWKLAIPSSGTRLSEFLDPPTPRSVESPKRPSLPVTKQAIVLCLARIAGFLGGKAGHRAVMLRSPRDSAPTEAPRRLKERRVPDWAAGCRIGKR